MGDVAEVITFFAVRFIMYHVLHKYKGILVGSKINIAFEEWKL